MRPLGGKKVSIERLHECPDDAPAIVSLFCIVMLEEAIQIEEKHAIISRIRMLWAVAEVFAPLKREGAGSSMDSPA